MAEITLSEQIHFVDDKDDKKYNPYVETEDDEQDVEEQPDTYEKIDFYQGLKQEWIETREDEEKFGVKKSLLVKGKDISTKNIQNSLFEDGVQTGIEYVLEQFGIDPKTIDFSDTKSMMQDVMSNIRGIFYPNEDVALLAVYIKNGGTMEEFLQNYIPEDFSKHTDEDMYRLYHGQSLDEDDLEDLISRHSAKGILKEKADEIRDKLGIQRVKSPEELAKEQKEFERKNKEQLDNFKKVLYDGASELKMKFKTDKEKRQFIDDITENYNWTNDRGEFVYQGNKFFAILNGSLTDYLKTAYYLFNREDVEEKENRNTKVIESINNGIKEMRNTKTPLALTANKNNGRFGQ